MTPAPAYHRPKVEMFSDAGSLGHVGLGWLAGRMDAPDTLATALIFLSYQIGQSASGESWPRIGGEMLEFSIGLLISRFTK